MSDLFSAIARQKEIDVLKTFRLKNTDYHDRYTEARDFERFYTKTYISEKYPIGNRYRQYQHQKHFQ